MKIVLTIFVDSIWVFIVCFYWKRSFPLHIFLYIELSLQLLTNSISILSHASSPRYSLTKSRGRYRYLHPEQINVSPTPLTNDSVVNPISWSPPILRVSKSNLLKSNPQLYYSHFAIPAPQKRILKSETCQHI